MKFAALLLLVVANIARVSALDGQLFVVTKGRDNVKMGAVVVLAYSASEFNSALAREAMKLAPEFEKTHQQIARLEREIKVAEIELRATGNLRDRKELALNQYDAIYANVWSALRGLTAIASAKTDADGRFKLSVPADGSVVLFAQASRSVVNSTEGYIWVARADRQAMILSNEQDLGHQWAVTVCDNALAQYRRELAARSEPQPAPKVPGQPQKGAIRIGGKEY